jgi:nicotinamide phosphoribosyltransferase
MSEALLNPIFYADFYKVGHVVQYPKGTQQVWSNWTPRTSRVHGQLDVVHFGLQYFIKKYLIDQFQDHFFDVPWTTIERGYTEFIRATLGVEKPKIDHLWWLHQMGYLPLNIYGVPEGDSTPLGCPSVVLTNTHEDFFWLPNYFETLLSMTLWKPSTSATTAKRLRRICERHATAFGETDLSFVDWQMHDFSMRGMSGLEDAVLSGMGHLLSFSGTDSIPAILAAHKYYGAGAAVGGSVPATEHSVMSAGTKEGEFETFKRLITQVYPSGVLSVVSDTWDLWKVLTDYLPRLKGEVLARDGKLVIRPDSGDPVLIISGDESNSDPRIRKGAMELIADAMGTDGQGHITKAGAIYGDSINEERADAILSRLRAKGLSPFNMVFGVGSFTYEFKTRDTYGFAMKATAVRRGGEVVPIFKDPVTDDGGKRSHRGIVAVYEDEFSVGGRPGYVWADGRRPEDLDNCAFRKVYSNGELLVDESFDEIRKRVRA